MSRPGFTLLELFLVIALLSMLAATAVPVFTGVMAGKQLGESAEQLRSLMYLTSAEAKQRGRRFQLRFVDPPEAAYLADTPAARSVEVRVEDDPLGEPGKFQVLAADWARWTVCGRQVQVAKVEVAEPTQISDSGSGQQSDQPTEPAAVVFAPDGRSQVGDVTVTLMNDTGDSYFVRLRAITGLATVERPVPNVE